MMDSYRVVRKPTISPALATLWLDRSGGVENLLTATGRINCTTVWAS